MNPILQNRNYLIAYTIFWVLVAGAHFLLFYYMLDVELVNAATDSLVYNLIYFPLGMAIWYVVRFNKIDTAKIFQLLSLHLISALSLSILWVLLSYSSVISIIPGTAFREFQRSILPSRFLIGLLYYIIMCLVYYLIIYYQNLREKMAKEAAVNTLLKEAELNALKLQINPHFIFNSLNSINSLILIKPDLAQEMVVKLSDFLRATLGGNSKHLVTLKDEIDFSKLYLEIEKIRFGEKLHFNINMDDNDSSRMVPHMIFQPLLENAVKHGVQQSSDPVTIDLDISNQKNFLTIIIKNNFEGISSAPGKKIGLKNIRERLTLIYNQADLLKTETKSNQFIATLKIPLTQNSVYE